MKKDDFTQLSKYHNKWVALKQDDENKVIAVGDTVKEVLRETSKQGIKSPLLTKTPQNYGTFIL